MPYIPVAVVSAGGGGGGDVSLIERKVLTGADDFDFTGIPATFTHLRLLIQARATNAGAVNIALRFNGDSGNNYDYFEFGSGGSGGFAAQSSGLIGSSAGSGDVALRTGWFEVVVYAYLETTWYRVWFSAGGRSETGAAGGQVMKQVSGTWINATDAIDQITIIPSAGATFEIGSTATLYGMT